MPVLRNLPKTASEFFVNTFSVLAEEKYGDEFLSLWLFRGYRDFLITN